MDGRETREKHYFAKMWPKEYITAIANAVSIDYSNTGLIGFITPATGLDVSAESLEELQQNAAKRVSMQKQVPFFYGV